MPTTISRVSDVEFDLLIEASADELKPDLDKALRRQRGRTTLKGFRPGKVPTSLVEKLYGKAVAYGVADEHVQQTYRAQVLDSDEYEVLGQPTITDLDYEYGSDLKATVRFGVRPAFEIADISGISVSRLAHVVSDDEVAEELERIREREAKLTVVEGPAAADSLVTVDLQRIDEESGAPIVGEKREDVAFFLGNEEIPEPSRKALTGLSAGESARLQLVQKDDETLVPFEATIKEVKLRDLPELTDEFVDELTKGEVKTLEEFRTDLASRMQKSVDRTSREMFEGDVVKQVLSAHDFDVPQSVVDMVLDGRLEEFKKQAGDRLPAEFDDGAFRDAGRPESVRQARWMFIRDKVVEDEGLEVTDEDRDAYFEETAAGDGLPPDFLARYYRSMPRLMQQLDDQLITRKAIGKLTGLITVVEKDRDAFAEEREHSHDHDHDHYHDHDH